MLDTRHLLLEFSLQITIFSFQIEILLQNITLIPNPNKPEITPNQRFVGPSTISNRAFSLYIDLQSRDLQTGRRSDL